ncbi:MAG: flippase [Arenimonas sp.]
MIARLLERLDDRQRAIVTNVAYLSASRVAQVAIAFTVGVFVARHLGPHGWGSLAYVASFVGLFGGIAAMGLDSVVVRDLVKEKDNSEGTRDILTAAFAIRAVAGIAAFAMAGAGAWFAGSDAGVTTMILIVAGGLLLQPWSVIDLHYQSRVMSKHVVRVRMAVLAITSVARVALVLLQAPLVAFAWLLLADVALAMLGLTLLFRAQHPQQWRFRLDRALTARLLKDAWPLAVTGILLAVYTNVDQVLVRQLLGDASAGHYAVVLSIGAALNFLPVALGQSVFPMLVEARSDPALYRRRLQQCFDVFIWGGIAVAVPIALFAEELLQLVYGPEYAGSGRALAIHIWGMVATLSGVITSYWLVAEGLQGLYPVRVLLSLAVCVILSILLIPSLGIAGAAVAAVVARVLASTLFYAFDPRTRILVAMQLRALWAPARLCRSLLG